MNLAKTISELRKKNGLTQEQVAVKLNISAAAVSKWETGNSAPDIQLLAPLARILKVSINELLSFELECSEGKLREIKQELIQAWMSGADAMRLCHEYLGKYTESCNLKIMIGGTIQMYSTLEKGMSEELYQERMKEVLKLYEQAEATEERSISDQARYLASVILIEQQKYDQAEEKLKNIYQSGLNIALQFITLGLKQEKWKETEKLCEGQLLMKLTEVYALLSQMSLIKKENHDTAMELNYLTAMKGLEDKFGMGMGGGDYALARYWLRQDDKQKAAVHFKGYCDKLITMPFTYQNNPYFESVQLQMDETGQRQIRKKVIEALLMEQEWYAIKDEPEYAEAISLLKNVRIS